VVAWWDPLGCLTVLVVGLLSKVSGPVTRVSGVLGFRIAVAAKVSGLVGKVSGLVGKVSGVLCGWRRVALQGRRGGRQWAPTPVPVR
jgi:hypothetical protein